MLSTMSLGYGTQATFGEIGPTNTSRELRCHRLHALCCAWHANAVMYNM